MEQKAEAKTQISVLEGQIKSLRQQLVQTEATALYVAEHIDLLCKEIVRAADWITSEDSGREPYFLGEFTLQILKDSTEKISAVSDRPVFTSVVNMLREGDTLVIWKLDRLARSLRQLVFLIDDFRTRKIELVSLSDNINTSSAQSILYTQIIGAFAQFERELMIERTKAGLDEARRRGRKLGRKPGLSVESQKKADAAVHMYNAGMKVLDICSAIKVTRGTLYRYLKANNITLKLHKNNTE
jgi:DNA invertase Pin-like site-specific DNA recombinase